MSVWNKVKAKIAGKEEDVKKITPKAALTLPPGAMQAMYRQMFTAGTISIPTDLTLDTDPLPEREQTEPILGFRGWNLAMEAAHEPRLRSVTAGDVWEGPILRAEHEPRDNIWSPATASLENRDLGIFAYSLVEGAYRAVTEHDWPVIGLVELFGKVVVHDRGYRAEACRIRELWVESYADKYREALAYRYQCDVHLEGLPVDEDLHVDDLPDPDECPRCGHNHPKDPLNCKERKDREDRKAEGDREDSRAIHPVPWEGGRSRIPPREEGDGRGATGALWPSLRWLHGHLTP